MASFVHYASPFAETEKPPPPVVLLLLQTDLNVHTSTGLLIHEDLEHLVPSAKKTVVPAMLTRKILEHHDAWEGGEHETVIIKTTVHALVDKLLDTTKSLSDQDRELVQEVYRQAAQMHPDLRKYENDWATRCIVQARLKATSSNASNKAAKEVMTDAIRIGLRTRKLNK
ncbi:hypothetical protein B0H13DRAFT_2315192 [Mycena leptocephala]|nr:hypothetical protein B0H13DRAFT_2315192 [Mycena leptocephala]